MIATQYCLFYCSHLCLSVSEWKDFTLMLAAIIAVPGVIITAFKAFKELGERRVESQKELELLRIKFTLEQHRRLFDDSVLYSVLSLIDSDSEMLAKPEMWDPKRKFITFFEEIELLISSGQINNNVAYYMFGYYAECAFSGKNFQIGIDLKEKYWGLFFKFTRDAKEFLDNCEKNPQLISDLKF